VEEIFNTTSKKIKNKKINKIIQILEDNFHLAAVANKLVMVIRK